MQNRLKRGNKGKAVRTSSLRSFVEHQRSGEKVSDELPKVIHLKVDTFLYTTIARLLQRGRPWLLRVR